MSPTTRSTSTTGAQRSSPSARRRRGAALEAALLEAAWDELCAVGYPGFTLDGVAARAGTSRPVLARRWSDRVDLVVAAIRHRAALAALDPPDTGTLRGDTLALLRQLSASVSETAGVLSFVLADYFDATGLSPSDLRERILAGTPSGMAAIIQRAVERGEIDPGRLSPRIASLPVDLVRHDLIMNRAPVPDETLVEIVDRLFLPLLGGEPPDPTPHRRTSSRG
ncbi:MAG TPA: TetR-like C-terminal domain-containing protein [Caulobacteraceae bacterium]|nr:TetR-like C-terminal domain-containing protein [Caulobacteraceae bacterium]